MEKRVVDLVTLDSLYEAGVTAVPPPDLLSIDAQGSAYEILLGAETILLTRVVALIVEAEFHPLYKDQKLFGHVADWLADRGFVFVRFLDFSPELTPFRSAAGLRGEGFQTSADALFFRKVDALATEGDPLQTWLKLSKLAFIAMFLNQFEYGFETLQRREAVLQSLDAGELPEGRIYLDFLKELWDASRRTPAIFPPTWSSKVSFEQSKARFRQSPNTCESQSKIVSTIRGLRKWRSKLKRSSQKRLESLSALLGPSSARGGMSYSEVELVLSRYSLSDQANLMRTMRLNKTRL